MFFHDVGKHVAVLGKREGLYGFHAGERLKAELRNIAEQEIAVVGKRKSTVPYLPVMHVAAVGCIGLIKTAAGGRACRPIEGIGILVLQYAGEDVFVHLDVVRLLARGGYPKPFGNELLHFVVAAPKRKRGMVA